MTGTGLLVLADDTTGALDTAGAFYARGYNARMHLMLAPESQRSDQVEAIDLGIRYASPRTAEAVLGEALRYYQAKGYGNLMIKVDSTLRGHVMLSVDVVRKYLPTRHVFLMPAFPAASRVCREGIYYADGQPITQTEYARDSAFSFPSDRLSGERTDVLHVPLRRLSTGSQELASMIGASKQMIISFDGQTQEELERIMQTASLMNAIVIGSAGAAYAAPPIPGVLRTGLSDIALLPSLHVVGSLNQRSRDQIAVLERGGVQVLRMHPSDFNDILSIERLNRLVQVSLQAGRSIVLATPGAMIHEALHRQPIDQVIGLVANVHDAAHHLVIVGGETARAVLRIRGVDWLDMMGEIEPGLPVSVSNTNLESVYVTKAGGFGDDHALSRVDQRLRGH